MVGGGGFPNELKFEKMVDAEFFVDGSYLATTILSNVVM
jgi:hypothetical protein